MTGYLRKINMGIFYKLIILSIIVFSGTSNIFGQCPTVDAGGDQTMCVSDGAYYLNGTATNDSTIIWQTTGDGTFNGNVEDPVYTLGTNDLSSGSVILSMQVYQYYALCSPGSSNPASSSMTLTIEAAPTLSIGSDQTICETDNVNLNAIVTNQASVLWTTSGNGTFSNDASVTAIYYPGSNDISNGIVQLTLTVTANSPCSDISDVLTVTINSLATADAGNDGTICEDGSYSLSDATATDQSSVLWSSSGSGTFSNTLTLNPTYSPSAADATNGSVTLTLQANHQSPCVGSVTDNMTLTIYENPSANAGGNDIMCENETSYSLSAASASNYSSLRWTSTGTGTFSDRLILNPTYSPSAADFTGGSVTLTLTANPNLPCGTVSPNSMTLSFASEPTVDAGADETICEGSNISITDATATLYDDLLWSTDGDGSFTNDISLTTTYVPGSTDISTGTVNLTLTATATGACSGSVNDTRVLTIRSNPTVDAGSDETICNTGSVSITATASDYLTLSWTSSGTGIFTNGTTLNPTYTPSAGDITAGLVTLTLTASAQNPCSGSSTDDMLLTISPSPTADAGGDDNYCTADANYQLNGSATDYTTVSWGTSGTGSFTNGTTLAAIYTPSPADITTGSVTLTLTVNGTGTCSSETDDNSMLLTILDEPTVDAGSDDVVCESSTYTLAGSATDYSSVNWTTSGDGSFVNSGTLTAIYTPGTNDIAAGTVTLTLSATGNLPCTNTVTDDMDLTIDGDPTSNAGSNSDICETDTYTTSGAVTNSTSYAWSTSGTGSFTNANNLITTYTPSAGDITNGNVSLTLTADADGACTVPATSTIVITIIGEPTADAGPDATICEGAYLLAGATATNYASISWSTSGDGNFADNTVENPVYTPGATDIGGTVVLTMSALPNSPCASTATNDVVLTVTEAASVYAGTNASICESTSTYTLSSATGSGPGSTSYLWTTSGSGSFINDAIVNATYQPSANDILNGGVTLTLTGINPPCADETSTMFLTIYENPTVDAGNNATICDNTTYSLTTASASDYDAITWTSSGTGSFNNDALENPIYTPSVADFAGSSVVLTMTATAISPCGGSVNDFMTLSFENEPTVDAGTGGTICEDGSFAVTDATAADYLSVNWTGGDGTFTGGTTLTPTYTPGPTDIIWGTVTLTLTAQPNTPCNNPVTDNTTLIIQSRPSVDAGNDETICEGSDLSLATSSASDYNTLLWTSTGGTGSFDDATIENPIYTPSAADISAGSVTLILTATSSSPCAGTESSTMLLTILQDPIANAGIDATICEDGTYFLFDAAATNSSVIVWTTSGDGGFDNSTIIHPIYTPGTADIAAGTVTLELNVTGTNPCMGFDSDQMTITIDPLPTVDAGTNSSICSGSVFPTSTASVIDASSTLWTTSGTGNFTNSAIVNTTYTPSAADITAGTITLTLTATGDGACSSTVSDDVVVTIVPEPTADAGPDQEVCENGITISTANASDYLNILWTSSGTAGTITNANTLTPTYTPSATDIAAGSVTLTLTASANTPCSTDATDDVIVTISADPVVNAGTDATICELDTYTINSASQTDAASILWTTSGDGTFLNSATLTPTYTPGVNDITNGSATLTLTATASLPCSSTPSDDMILTIQSLAIVEAGTSTSICAGDTYTTTDATASNYNSLLWTTSGDGVFNNDAVINTIYTPGATDISNGTVVLTLAAENNSPCTGSETDNITITFVDEPTADAGSDETICETDSHTISGATANDYSTILWTTNGNGTFTDETTLSPTYIPGSADIAAGSAILTITVNGIGACGSTASSQMILTIIPIPIVDAGSDGSVCEGETFNFSDASASEYLSYAWSTSGSGSFTNGNTLTPTYTPDAADVVLGSVIITLTAIPNSPCVGDITDFMTLDISALPTVNAGNDETICETETVNITTAIASDYLSLLWTSSGSGIFSDAAALNPTYTPSAADIAAATVTLTLTANSNSPCSTNPSDDIIVTIAESAVAYAGADADVCEGTTYTINDATASNYTSVAWTHTGSGTITDAATLSPSYSPSAADAIAGSVTFTLTATGSALCPDSTDQIVLTIIANPIVDAGSDATVCDNANYQIVGVTASNYTALSWTTSGTGVFSNPNILLPEYIPSAADLVAGSVDLTIEATAVSPCTNTDDDTFTLSFESTATAYAGADETICSGSTITISGATATNSSSILWSTSGTGSFTSGNTLSPTYDPSAADKVLGSVTLTLNVIGNAPCGDVTDDMLLTIQGTPTAYAGTNASICEDQTYTVFDATATNYDVLTWISSGSGVITNPNGLTPTYTPSAADLIVGQVTLTLEATATAPCVGSVTSSMTLNFNNQPSLNAGADATICEGDVYTNNDATASDYAGLLWTTSGSGTFSNNTLLNTTYDPSIADFINGTVTLTLTATPNSPCAGIVVDDIVLTLIPDPVIDAGDDGTICEGTSFTVSTASASLYDSYYWISSGTGTLTGATSLTPTYTPSAVDIAAGSVTLTLRAEGAPPCSTVVTDAITLTIISEPLVDAGSDAELCSGESYTVNDASASDYATINWTTSGSGAFINPNSISPSYTPSAGDYAAGSVDLTLTATSNSPCSTTITDIMTITLFAAPVVDAGSDDAICEDETYTLVNATASDYSLLTWTTDGDGSFSNTGDLNPIYTPGTNDIIAGSVILRLNADANAPCTGTETDFMTLTISLLPIAYAGPDTDVCEGSYTINGATAQNYTSLNWTTSGTGTLTNANSITPTYTASAADITNGNVVLTLTVTSTGNCTATDTDDITLNLFEIPEANAGNDGTICEDGSFNITSSSASNYSTVLWTTAGDGTFSTDNTIQTVYTPGSNDLVNGSVILTLTANAIAPCSTTDSDDVEVSIDVLPTVYAGSDESICAGPFTVTDASASNYASFIWSASGSGVLTNASTLTPTYTPDAADIANGSVTLTLTATANGACSGLVQDAKIISFSESVTVDAGSDDDICGDDIFTVSTATASNYGSVSWATSGNGVFADINSLTPTYTPSVDDIASGSVTLTVTAIGQAPCGGTQSSDMILTIQAPPTAYAGADANIDAGNSYTVGDATASNYASVFWESTGTGTFIDDNTLVPTYTPSATDIAAGQVTLTLNSISITPCLNDATDQLILTIGALPTVDAGPDAIICENGLFTVTGSSASDYSAILWTSSGTGLLTNEATLYPTYEPSSDDILAGSVVLTATVTALPPSIATASDFMIINFHNLPLVDAGGDASICDTEEYIIVGSTASGYSDIYWTTSGTGLFSPPNQVNTIYIPSASDIANGSVILTLHAESQMPCTSEVIDNATLTFNPTVTVDAGVDATICAGGSLTINTATASDYASIEWTYNGSGTIIDNNTLYPTYYPSAADEIAGSVILTLTGTGNLPCDTPESDDMTLFISSSPTVYAGADTSVCTGSDFELVDATANNYSSLIWSTSGTGTFNNVSILNPTYMFSAADIAGGSVTLTLTVVGNAVCPGVYVDQVVVTINELPTAEAGTNETICQGDFITITTASASNYSSLLWTSDGTGNFVNGTTISPTYIPSNDDNLDGLIVITLTATAIAPCSSDANDQMILSIDGGSVAYAGADASICEGMNYTIPDAYALNYTSYSWTHSGQGTLTNVNTLNPTYNPHVNDYVTGSVTITLTAQGGSPCPAAFQDFMVLSLNNNPTVDAGGDDAICEGSSYTLSGVATDQQSVLWITSGDGSFDDATLLAATYTPGTNDIVNGTVDLSLTAFAIAPCTTDANDVMTLTIQPPPTVDAGADVEICANNYTLSGSATNQQSVLWTTSGDGIFDDATLLAATYTPGANDFINGSVDLTLIALAISPCGVDAVDIMTLTVNEPPTVDAGADDVVCDDNTYTLSGSATNQLSVLWTTSGDGTFDDATLLAATYTLGTNDIINGTVDLSLTAYALAPCESTDIMTLTIQNSPTADAGADDATCDGSGYLLSGIATNETSVLWTTSGDGTFDDATLLAATYTPGTNDETNGTVDLTLTAFAIAPCGTDATDVMTLIVQTPTSVDAGADDLICEDDTYTLSGSATNQSSVLWTTSGDGTFDNATLLAATYTPGTNDITNGTVDLSLTAYALPCQSTDVMTLTIQGLPTSNAGVDDVVCEVSTYTLSGSATNQQSVLWTTAGDGTFDDVTLLAATYTLGTNDITNGTVDLTLTASPIAPCGTDATDVMTLTIQDLPTVDAGPDDITCSNIDYVLVGTASNEQSVLWTTAGDGTFSNPTFITASYTPGTNDIANGTVDLTLTALAIAPCGTDATDVMTLTIQPIATADAGADDTICENDSYILSGSVTNEQSFLWTTSGDGTFDDAGLLTASYTPGTNDITNGTVDLTLTASPIAPCATDITDVMTLTIQGLPIADAGTNDTICEDNTYTLSGIATNEQSVLWTTSGDGSFDDATLKAATYSPGTNDIINETVDLTFTTYAITPCAIDDTDVMTLIIQGLPTVDAGLNDTICENNTYTLSGTATDQQSVLWTTFGDGVFDDATLLAATYTPGANDITNGTVDLSLTAYAFLCELSDTMTLIIQGLPTVNAGTDDNVCIGTPYTLSGSATNAESVIWTTLGDGSFDDASLLAATYTLGAADENTTSVTLILEATGINACNSSVVTDTIILRVLPQPEANFTYDIIICDSIQFTDLSTSADGYNLVSWYWEFGDGSTSDLQNPTHQYPHTTTPGGEIYNVSLFVMADSNGFICSDSIVLPVVVPESPDIFYTFDPDPTCLGDTTFFYGESGYAIDTWHWDFDDGNFSTLQYTNHLFSDTGSYFVELNIVDTNGCVNNLTNVVRVNPVPDVSFTMDNSTICYGNTISFFGSGSSNIQEWYWDFGDGSFSYDQNPIHYFITGGTYTVSLTVTDSTGCSNSTSQDVLVLFGPTADYSYVAVLCNTVQFTDESTAPSGYFLTEFFWDFDDGFTSYMQDPVHSFATGGSHIVMLIVTADSSGYSCSDTTTQIVIVPEPPSVFFTWDPEPTTLGDPTSFFGTSGNNITNWYWDFGDGTFESGTNQNVVHTYLFSGIFDVTLIVTDIGGCINSITHQVSIGSIPEVDFHWDIACMGEGVQFYIDSPPTDIPAVVSWLWDFGDGGTSFDMEPIHVYNADGTYDVSLTIVDTMGSTNTLIKSIIVNPLPNAIFSIDAPICSGNPVQFHDYSNTPTGYITEWFWDFGDGSDTTVYFPDNPDVSHTYNSLGTFIVTLSVLNSDSCTGSSSNSVTTIPSPIAMFNYTSGCANAFVEFTDISVENGGGNIISWQWDFDDPASGTNNTSNLQHPVHQFSGFGTYDVSLIITNVNGCTSNITTTVTVGEEPPVDFTFTNACLNAETIFEVDTIVTNVSEIQSYLWDFGDGNTSILPNPTHAYSTTGDYIVTLSIVTTNGCTASISHTISINPLPNPNFAHTAPDCLNEPIYFTDLSNSPNGSIVKWYWDFGDGNDTTIMAPDNPDVSHIYALEGIFDVSLSVTDSDSCENTIVKQVVTLASPIADYTYEETCYGVPVLFTDLSSTNGGPDLYSWEWYFGDPLSGINNSSNIQNPSHLFTDPGTYTVTLVIVNTIGCSDTTFQEIIVDSLPDVDFTMASDTICLDQQAQFTGIGSNINSWFWEFGDGGTSIQQSPAYSYMAPGSYTVTLTVIDGDGCQNSISQLITVKELPLANFNYELPLCAETEVQFIDQSSTSSGTLIEWIWDFGDGSAIETVQYPDDPNLLHAYALPGTYNVTLIVMNSDSCTAEVTNDIIIIPSPEANFSFTDGCFGQSIEFTDLSAPNGGQIISWDWNFGDPSSGASNTSTSQNPSHLFTSSGDFVVTLIIWDINGCGNTTFQTVTMSDPPTVDFTYTAACLGMATQFTVDENVTIVADVQSFDWDFGDGNTSTSQNPSHIYATMGSYEVTLTITTMDGCIGSVTHSVEINPLPNANFENTSPACLGNPVYFTDLSSSPNGNIVTWFWDFGDGTTATINDPDIPDVEHIYDNDATYDVSLTVTDSEGCEHTIIKQVQVLASPIADFNYEETCFGTPVYFTDMSSPNGGVDMASWEWFFGDPNSGVNNHSDLQNPTHIFSIPDITYTTTLIVVNTMGCSDTIEYEITVDSLPFVNFTIANDSICLGESAEFTGVGTDISTWFWEFGDGGVSIDQNPTYMYAAPGIYTVTLTVTEIGTDQCQNSISHDVYVNAEMTANFSYENACLGDSTYFMDLSYSQMGFIVEWLWDFGDGTTSTLENPSHYYNDNDNYEVSLTSTDNFGCSDTRTQWIQVFDSPVPGFTFDQVCDPEGQVNFFDLSEMGEDNSPIVSWNWNLDDGYYSTEINPSYIYPSTDSCYTVILEITDANGCVSVDTNDQVCLHGTLEIDFSTTEECLGIPTFFETTYSPENDSVASYTWNFNDGSPLEDTYHDTISHIFPNPGLYIVELMALDTNGCSSSTFGEVVVDSLPTAQFTNTIGNCTTPTQFTDISFGGGEFIEFWYWDFGDISSGGDNFSTLENPSHLYGPSDSIYQVKLIVTNFNGCIDSIVQEVFVDPCLSAEFELPADPVCSRFEVCFTDISMVESNNGAISEWQWDFGDGDTYSYQSLENPICHTYADPGDYDVQLVIIATVNGNIYSDTATMVLTVNPTPMAAITVDNNCFGDSTYFFDASDILGEEITMWHWDFGDDSNDDDTAIIQNPVYMYPSYNTYETQLKVMNQFGCRDSITEFVTIHKPPQAEFSFDETCMSYITYFTDESVSDSANIEHYYWNFGDTLTIADTSNMQNPEYIYDSTGFYDINMIVIDQNQCADTISHQLEIYPIPTSGFNIFDTIQQGQIYLENLSIEATNYYWDFDFDYGVSTTQVSPFHQYELDGTYNIMLIAYNDYGCPDTTFKLYDLLFTNLFVPNAFVPSNSNPDLQVFKPVGINLRSYSVEVYSPWGNRVFESTTLVDGAPADGWDGTFKGQQLPTGSYTWRISAVFIDGSFWKGTDNGDGNVSTSGTVTLIR